jgi:hypothetical protein
MPTYLSSSFCISYQNTVSDTLKLKPLAVMEQPVLVEPNYKVLLKPALLRRMSKVLKMGNYSAKAVLTDKEGNVAGPDAIVVGTGLGCIRDTIGFIDEVLKNDEQTLAPTAFIQSTHNSIAGQIALMLQNYRYNMTIVQKSISFEMALMDAELQLATGNAKSVLVGAADELTENLENLLKELAAEMNVEVPTMGEGSAFFLATAEKQSDSIAEVETVATLSNGSSLEEFLQKNEIDLSRFDIILNGDNQLTNSTIPQINFKDYCGEYFTAPAFATHLALEAIKGNFKTPASNAVKRVLILNTFGGNYGAIGLKAV